MRVKLNMLDDQSAWVATECATAEGDMSRDNEGILTLYLPLHSYIIFCFLFCCKVLQAPSKCIISQNKLIIF
jgi:hypothetical protein